MAKDPAYYFPHDYNARKDPKCIALIKDFGMTGYGVYWCLIEIMYEQGGKIKKFPSLYSALSHELRVTEKSLTKQIEAMLHNYELLVEDATHLWSNAVLNRLEIREAKRHTKIEAGKLGGIKSGESRRNKNGTKQNEALLQADEANEAKKRKGKERKEEERKENKRKGEEIVFPFSDDFKTFWSGWVDYKKQEHKENYNSQKTEQSALNHLYKLSEGNENTAREIIDQSISNAWKGLFELKQNYNGTGNSKQSGSKNATGEQVNQAFTKFYNKG